MWTLHCAEPARTRALGRALAEVARPSLLVALHGDLGAGKTCFAQGVGEGLGVVEDVVSPTFVLVAEYEAACPLMHVDAYRIEPEDIAQIGLDELLDTWEGLALVEWAGRVAAVLPDDRLVVRLLHADEGRRVEIEATGPGAQGVLEAWRRRWEEQAA